MTPPRQALRLLGVLVPLALSAACTSEASTIGTPLNTSVADGSVVDTTPVDMTVRAGRHFPSARCLANEAAGTITFLTGFDYSAAASMIDVYVARARGYYRDVCLDVEIKPSFSTDNYPLIAADGAQFASGGSFGELVEFAGRNEAQFKALAVEGHTGIDTLIVKPGAAATLEDLEGTTIGIKDVMTSSVKAMLLKAGLVEHEDYETAPLDALDPVAHIEDPDIVGFPGYKSNEPLQLEAAGIAFDTFDPADYAIPGSFGVIYTNASFIEAYPTAAEDFMRATMRGLHDAIADPAMASAEAIALIQASGNTMNLSPAGEVARWNIESRLVADGTTPSLPAGVPRMDALEREVDSFAEIGVFNGIKPDYTTMVDANLLASIYDDEGTVIWPS